MVRLESRRGLEKGIGFIVAARLDFWIGGWHSIGNIIAKRLEADGSFKN
jgi:hypothetical protein